MYTPIVQKVWPEWSLTRHLGSGAYGVVYEAVRQEYGIENHCAIKIISIPSSQSEIDSLRAEGMDEQSTRKHFETIVKDFVNEIHVMVSLDGHPNIVNVKDYKVVPKENQFGWDILIMMELLTPLSEHICDRSLTEAEVIQLGCDICSALETCHKGMIIHRDVKPGNIMVHSKVGQYKLGDFGIARKLESLSTGLSQRYTPKYMAPEVVTTPYYDSRVDICSLGVVLYQLLNDMRIPFQENKQVNSMRDIEMAIQRRTHGEPLPRPSHASDAMAAVILKACAFDPKDRFATATEMKAALISVANGTYRSAMTPDQTTAVRKLSESDRTVSVRSAPQVSQPVPQKFLIKQEPPTHKSTKVIAIIGVILLISIIAAALIYFATRSPQEDNEKSPDKTTELVAAESNGEPPDQHSSELVTKPIINLPTESITEAPTEPIIESTTEPITEPPTEPITEPPTEPITEPPTEPITEPPTKPTTEPPTEPITEPPTEPITEPPTKPTTAAPTVPVTTAPTVPKVDSGPSAEYLAIFDKMNIDDSTATFPGKNYDAYAMYDSAEDVIVKFEFGHKNDIVTDMIITYHIGIPTITAEEKAALESAMSKELTIYDQMDCCADTGAFVSDNHYTFYMHFTDMENSATIVALEELEICRSNTADGLICMSALDAELISDGAVKR